MKRSFASSNTPSDGLGPPREQQQEQSNKRLRTVSLLGLEPFAFFIRAPPVAYAQHYYKMADHIEGLINGDFSTDGRLLSVLTDESVATQDWLTTNNTDWIDEDSKLSFRDQWRQIEAAANDPRQTQA